MSDTSKIEWTDATWNPVTGCTKVSQGCKHCYAERLFPRVYGGQKVVTRAECLPEEVRPRRFTDVWTHPDRLDQPLRWKKPRRIFVNSMGDLFHEDVPNQFIADVFAVMACTTRHSYQVLTKRPQRMLEWFRWLDAENHPFGFPSAVDPTRVWPQWTPARGNRGGYDNCGPRWPLENVWLGVSVEDQASADERIPLILQTPAAIRFASYEPALDAVNFKLDHLKRHSIEGDGVKRLDWLIVGGESGPKARPFDLAWARNTIKQCKAAGVPVFVKQLGRFPMPESDDLCGLRSKGHSFYRGFTLRYCDEDERVSVDLKDRAGGNPAEWPEDLRVREFPQ